MIVGCAVASVKAGGKTEGGCMWQRRGEEVEKGVYGTVHNAVSEKSCVVGCSCERMSFLT